MTREMLAFLLVMIDLQITGVVCRLRERGRLGGWVGG